MPEHIQRRAREAYRRFKDNPNHPSFRVKQVHATIWFWIGPHSEYDQLLRAL